VDIFCGGPKFGDMLSGRTVMTKAEGSTFGKYFGAGYGGNAYNRYAPSNQNNKMNIDWNAWVRGQYTQTYSSTYKGVSTQIDYQFIPMSGNADNVCRLFVDYVGFSLATTHDVTSSLTGCTITSDFYGGGSLGKVVGDVTSTLTDCTVEGNVFGAGFSGTRPTVEVDSIGFRTEPYYYTDLGTYRTGVKGATTTYTWEHGNAISIDKTNHILYTTEDLTSLGTVSGKVTLNIEGNTLVKGNVTEEGETTQSGGVFGGGDASAALGDTELNFNASGQKSEGYNSYNVFGGGNKADVGGKVTVNMKNGVVAHDIYGGGALANTNTENWVSNTLTPQYKEVTLEVGTSLVGYYTKSGDVYVAATGTAESGVKYYKLTNTTIYLTGGTVNGDVYGGGLGNETTAALVYGDVEVILNGTKMKTGHTTGENPVLNAGRVFGANNINGTPKGHVKVLAQKTAGIEGQAIDVAAVFGGGNLAPYQPSGTTDYAEVEINMTSGSGSRLVIGDVFGGGNQAGIEAGTQVNIMAGDVKTGVYGGCNIEGTVFGDATVTVSGGNIGHGSIDPATKVFSYTSKANVHGGGYGNDTYVKGDVVVNIGAAKTTSNEVTTGEGDETTTTTVTTTTYEGTAVIYGDVYGGGALGHVNAEKNTAGTMPTFITAKKTTVNLNKGIVYGDAYGGGLGIKDPQNTANEVPAYVGGDVTVNQREVAFYINKGTYARITKTAEETTTETVEYPQTGRIFGCNNANGSPQGEVTVNVYKTVGLTASGEITSTKPEIGSAYELAAVYGGGNLAAYEPAGSANKTNVNIDGCDDVSIKQVYGGGNAAPTPATYVEVNGCYDIDEVFGGGNGYDYYFIDGKTYINPGANVGYKTYTHLDDDGTGAADNPYNPVENDNAKTAADRQNASNGYVYGTGIAEVAIYGGTIRAVYGGSNEKGNIRYQAKSLYDDGGECTMSVKEKYGGGKNSNFDGEILLNLGCTQDNDVVYGGSKNADVNSDIVLNITNGTYKKVFGGNNTSGAVNGSITVNIKETGCSPIIIEELYLGGYLAPYSVYGYEKDGEGNYVTNVLKDKDGNDVLDDDGNVIRQPIPLLNGSDPKPAPRINIISASRIDNIYGGGYQATVVGDPHVNVNMEQGMIEAKYVRDSESNPFVSEHTDADGKLLWKGERIEKDEDDKVIKGILAIGYIGNIYGGGNEADVIGDTYVEIATGKWLKDGKDDEWETAPARNAANIEGAVFGGGKGLPTNLESAKVTGDSHIDMAGGTVKKSIYGGGQLARVEGNTNIKVSGGAVGDETVEKGGAETGNVYGGGMGDLTQASAGLIKGNTNIEISGGNIYHNVYGGGAYGSVGNITYGAATYVPGKVSVTGMPLSWAEKAGTDHGKATITITGGTIGINGNENGMIFGSSRGDVQKLGNDGIDPNDRLAWVYDTHVIIGDESAGTGKEGGTGAVFTAPLIKGSIYGSGENGHTFNSTQVDIHSGKIGITDDDDLGGADFANRGNVYGGGCGNDMYDSDDDDVKDAYNPLAGIVLGTATVNIDGGHVVHNVYGAGAMGSVGNASVTTAGNGKTTITISGGRIGDDGVGDGNVYGAARGDLDVSGDSFAQVKETKVEINYATTPTADNEGKTEQLIAGSVFGGGEAGLVKGSVEVDMKKGLVLHDLYGGGALANTNISNATNYGKNNETVTSTSTYKTTVNLTGGTVEGDVYGGGLGQIGREADGDIEAIREVKAMVYGDVDVTVNGTKFHNTKGKDDQNHDISVSGRVFGSNNLNGTPLGHVKVAVSKTVPYTGEDHVYGVYEIAAVYGGGNLAPYEPVKATGTDAEKAQAYSEVIIDGCDVISIEQVYGGGNAASTPGTQVTVNGTFEIGELFGGGNGKDRIQKNGVWMANPGANVGYYAYPDNLDYATRNAAPYIYGMGEGHVNMYGGTIHAVYGGSNTKGNVRVAAVAMLDGETDQSCEFHVDEAYGGGKSADMDGKAILELKCIKGLSEIYGGAKNADVNNDVMLNLTNGTYDQVFGGNNVGGRINGKIVVNIEETGCNPVIIGELYGGGNRACYSVYGYQAKTDEEGETVTDSDGKTVWLPLQSGSDPKADPVVNVKSFTSIGNIYGGGYGESAVMVASPRIYVDEVYGRWYNQDQSVYAGTDKLIGGNVVTIPDHAKGKIGAIQNVYGGGNAAQVIGDTYVNIGTQTTVDFETGIGTAEAQKNVPVVGVDIRGNVYGGGNQANVTGKTNVMIGK